MITTPSCSNPFPLIMLAPCTYQVYSSHTIVCLICVTMCGWIKGTTYHLMFEEGTESTLLIDCTCHCMCQYMCHSACASACASTCATVHVPQYMCQSMYCATVHVPKYMWWYMCCTCAVHVPVHVPQYMCHSACAIVCVPVPVHVPVHMSDSSS